MPLTVQLSDRAERDLARQYHWYVKHASQDVAERYLAAYDTMVARLALHPGLGVARKFAHRSISDVRSWALESPFAVHLIFYHATADTLIVDRVMHGARDLPRQF